MIQETRPTYRERARRTRREIVLAVVLTVAAIAFLIAALMSTSQHTASAGLHQAASSGTN